MELQYESDDPFSFFEPPVILRADKADKGNKTETEIQKKGQDIVGIGKDENLGVYTGDEIIFKEDESEQEPEQNSCLKEGCNEFSTGSYSESYPTFAGNNVNIPSDLNCYESPTLPDSPRPASEKISIMDKEEFEKEIDVYYPKKYNTTLPILHIESPKERIPSSLENALDPSKTQLPNPAQRDLLNYVPPSVSFSSVPPFSSVSSSLPNLPLFPSISSIPSISSLPTLPSTLSPFPSSSSSYPLSPSSDLMFQLTHDLKSSSLNDVSVPSIVSLDTFSSSPPSLPLLSLPSPLPLLPPSSPLPSLSPSSPLPSLSPSSPLPSLSPSSPLPSLSPSSPLPSLSPPSSPLPSLSPPSSPLLLQSPLQSSLSTQPSLPTNQPHCVNTVRCFPSQSSQSSSHCSNVPKLDQPVISVNSSQDVHQSSRSNLFAYAPLSSQATQSLLPLFPPSSITASSAPSPSFSSVPILPSMSSSLSSISSSSSSLSSPSQSLSLSSSTLQMPLVSPNHNLPFTSPFNSSQQIKRYNTRNRTRTNQSDSSMSLSPADARPYFPLQPNPSLSVLDTADTAENSLIDTNVSSTSLQSQRTSKKRKTKMPETPEKKQLRSRVITALVKICEKYESEPSIRFKNIINELTTQLTNFERAPKNKIREEVAIPEGRSTRPGWDDIRSMLLPNARDDGKVSKLFAFLQGKPKWSTDKEGQAKDYKGELIIQLYCRRQKLALISFFGKRTQSTFGRDDLSSRKNTRKKRKLNDGSDTKQIHPSYTFQRDAIEFNETNASMIVFQSGKQVYCRLSVNMERKGRNSFAFISNFQPDQDVYFLITVNKPIDPIVKISTKVSSSSTHRYNDFFRQYAIAQLTNIGAHSDKMQQRDSRFDRLIRCDGYEWIAVDK